MADYRTTATTGTGTPTVEELMRKHLMGLNEKQRIAQQTELNRFVRWLKPGAVLDDLKAEDVERFTKVWVRALDYHGKPFEMECEGLLSIAVQHETDHLEGTLFVDHLSSLKRELIKRRMKKLKAQRAADAADAIKKAPQHETAL